MSILSQNLSSLRKKRGISQKSAASQLGISQALLSHYEKGIRECSLEFLGKLADFYNVSTDYLLGREDTYALNPLMKAMQGKSTEHSPEHENSKRITLQAIARIYAVCDEVQNKKLQEELDQTTTVYLYYLMRVLQLGTSTDKSYYNLPEDRALLFAQSYLQTCYLRICKRVEALPAKKQELIDFGSESLRAEHPACSAAISSLINEVERKYSKSMNK